MDMKQLQAAIQNVHDENLRAILQAFFDYNFPTPKEVHDTYSER